MGFKENLAELQPVDAVKKIDLYNSRGNVIDSIEDQRGSVQVYANMTNFAGGKITSEMVVYGLDVFAEHTAKARDDVSSHSNIQRLFRIANGEELSMKLVYDSAVIRRDIEAIENIEKDQRMGNPAIHRAVRGLVSLLETGDVRAAEKRDGTWAANAWVKQGILYGFGGCGVVPMEYGPRFMDKELFPPRDPSEISGARMVPGGTSIRGGAHIAPGVIAMPPVYANVGAFVDSGTMLDSHSLAGSCAQIGKNCHISAGAQVGGVLEPVNATPCVVEDNAFMGINTSISEGTILSENSILAPGVNLTASGPVYQKDGKIVEKVDGKTIIPAGSVVVPGYVMIGGGLGKNVAIIMKIRDEKTSASIALEEALR